ncbi:hypothetical protein AQI88_26435 [Streptomyces cellostaticus]|uniref:Uncharacterized protein n=1 Tax=Streptomyces cellostaticus TaxID=67285 RepID=A0A117PV48_9ACTN|nr:hypothetical protein [Streptomyces cellostaticus]KUM93517.1 hypothetical protein AQI88_26435 [Streptomyces cellostaticus]GHI10170.1 hypothetical protein Scel_84910 [Streptomyces cellostaticus]
MSKLPRACAALGLTLLAASALGAAGSASAGLAHTRTPMGKHIVIQAAVNNTGSEYHPPGAKM